MRRLASVGGALTFWIVMLLVYAAVEVETDERDVGIAVVRPTLDASAAN